MLPAINPTIVIQIYQNLKIAINMEAKVEAKMNMD
ncbi:hypothetical protein B2K_38780 [Paenibacillus mucilaginosus K02]|uniref:Uncharacterized protein n=1 Tax=Paenibacillus mucilaginosus K02 TaxID=997761 RepID=R9UPP5_9BACL|nr:hypothetical protein B2K_38780 [Paenibacillus mucilaginosus K02]